MVAPTATLPKRAEVAREHTWALESIFASDTEWEAAFAAVRAAVPDLVACRGTLGRDAASLLRCFQLRDDIARRADRLAVYSFLRRDEDTANATYQALADRAASLGVEIGAAQSFIDPELLQIPDETLAAFIAAEPGLAVYRHAIDETVRLRPHTRSAEVEELLAQTRDLGRAPSEIYNFLNDADLKFPTITDAAGNSLELTHGRFLRCLESPDRRVRHDAFHAFYAAYATIRNTTAATLNAGVKRNIFYARARGYPSALEATLTPNAIPAAVYHQLIATVHRHLPLLHRYFALRQRALAQPDLRIYDLYTPLAAEVDRSVPWSEAVDLVTRAFAPLGDEYIAAVSRGLRERWVDVYENEGKSSGAYSWGAFDTQPFILMNYQNDWNGVFTLAHELGHSLHSYLTRRTQPYVYGGYTTFLAEIASTLNEALLVEHLLQTSDDPRLRLFVINHQLDAFRGTLFRQTMFAEFELLIHRTVEEGGALTADGLAQRYFDLVGQYHGPGVTLDDQIRLEWSRIPHFYMNFYVYQYATGICAAMAMTRQILDEGQPAVRRFLHLLSSGSSGYSVDMLREAGVDMTTSKPVEDALALFARRLDEAEALLG